MSWFWDMLCCCCKSPKVVYDFERDDSIVSDAAQPQTKYRRTERSPEPKGIRLLPSIPSISTASSQSLTDSSSAGKRSSPSIKQHGHWSVHTRTVDRLDNRPTPTKQSKSSADEESVKTSHSQKKWYLPSFKRSQRKLDAVSTKSTSRKSRHNSRKDASLEYTQSDGGRDGKTQRKARPSGSAAQGPSIEFDSKNVPLMLVATSKTENRKRSNSRGRSGHSGTTTSYTELKGSQRDVDAQLKRKMAADPGTSERTSSSNQKSRTDQDVSSITNDPPSKITKSEQSDRTTSATTKTALSAPVEKAEENKTSFFGKLSSGFRKMRSGRKPEEEKGPPKPSKSAKNLSKNQDQHAAVRSTGPDNDHPSEKPNKKRFFMPSMSKRKKEVSPPPKPTEVITQLKPTPPFSSSSAEKTMPRRGMSSKRSGLAKESSEAGKRSEKTPVASIVGLVASTPVAPRERVPAPDSTASALSESSTMSKSHQGSQEMAKPEGKSRKKHWWSRKSK